jgi:hypothetical protein
MMDSDYHYIGLFILLSNPPILGKLIFSTVDND